MSKFVKGAAAAAIIIAVAAGATGASAGASVVAAKQQNETIFKPHAMPGCWTDNGYGRFSSCDAG